MRALTYQGVRRIAYETVPDPSIVEPGDAVVAVRASAVCGSDLHVYHGRETGLDAGTVMGHEFTGEVVAVGRSVTTLQVGQRVMSPFSTSCGACFYCRAGLTARCSAGQLFGWVERGAGLHGAQAEFVRVPLADATLIACPDEVDDAAALLVGDVLATGFHAARQADVVPGGSYVVLGCGPVGLMAVVAARHLGAEALYAVDDVPERLALAERFGATALDRRQVDVPAFVREATGGRGADGVLEAVGSEAAARLAFDLVRPGGTISIVGVHHEARFAFSPGEAYDKNLTVRIGRCPARHYMEALLPLAATLRPDLAAIFTHRQPLSAGPAAYELFAGHVDGCVKVLLTPA
jgi:threonine dehydrogenase-like Zn-dependent dehydrogenase